MDNYIMYPLNIAQLLSDRYTTTDPVWSLWLESKMLWQLRFFTSATVVLNHFADGIQIKTYNFVRKPH